MAKMPATTCNTRGQMRRRRVTLTGATGVRSTVTVAVVSQPALVRIAGGGRPATGV